MPRAAARPEPLHLLAQAEERREGRRCRGFYFDLLQLLEFIREKDFQYPSTMSIPHLFALDVQLETHREGRRRDGSAPRDMAAACRAGRRSTSRCYPAERWASTTVSCIRNTRGISVADLNKELGKRNLNLSNGYGKLKEQTFRIAHMGDLTMSDIDELLGAVGGDTEVLGGIRSRRGARSDDLFLAPGGAVPTILGCMEDLKSCLFCGKHVDSGLFQYCPRCGYSWAGRRRADRATRGRMPAASPERTGARHPRECRRPRRAPSPRAALEELLSDMERELDLIIRDLFNRSLITLRSSSSDPRLRLWCNLQMILANRFGHVRAQVPFPAAAPRRRGTRRWCR